MDKNHRNILLFIFLTVIILGININVPWGEEHCGLSGSHYSVIARNYLRYGLLKTKFGCVMNSGYLEPHKFNYYISQPPLLPMLIAVSFLIFGVSEASARLVPALFAIGFTIVFYLFIDRFFKKRIALLSSIFLIFTPIFMYFGNFVGQETIALFFIIMFFYNYFSWIESEKGKNLFLMLISFIFSTLIGWIGYFLIVPICINQLLSKKYKRNSIVIILLTISGFVFSLHLFHASFLMGFQKCLNCLANRLLSRTDIFCANRTSAANPWEFFSMEIFRCFCIFTPVLIFLSTIWIVSFIRKIRPKSYSKGDIIVFSLLTFGFAPLFIFQNLYFNHNFFLFYCLPFFAIASAAGLDELFKKPFGIKRTRYKLVPIVIIFILYFCFSIITTYLLYKNGDIGCGIRPKYYNKLLGGFIGKNTVADEVILTNQERFPLQRCAFVAPIIDYYSDRNIIYDVQDYNKVVTVLATVDRSYIYFLLSKKYPIEKNLLDLLEKSHSFKLEYDDSYFLYKINGASADNASPNAIKSINFSAENEPRKCYLRL